MIHTLLNIYSLLLNYLAHTHSAYEHSFKTIF
jgi:hypothetical protein